jgi:cold shock protein
VIAVDVRCPGRSEKPIGPFALADIADDLDAMLRALNPEAPADGARGPLATRPSGWPISRDRSCRIRKRRKERLRRAFPSVDVDGWYNAAKGFGFIGPDQGDNDIFVHASVLDRAGIIGLAEGQRVAVDVAHRSKGPEAAGLRLI